MNDTVANPADATPLDTSPAPATPPIDPAIDPATDPAQSASAAPAPTLDAAGTPVAAAATTAAVDAPAASAPTQSLDIIDARLERIASLVKTLSENPAIHTLLCTLMGGDADKRNKTD